MGETMKKMKDAPTDGTPILLHTTCHGWCEAWFSPSEPAAWDDWYADEAIGAAWVCCDDAFQMGRPVRQRTLFD